PAKPTPAVAAPAAAPVAHAAPKPTAVGGKRAAVQLASHSSEAAAKTEWQRMEKRMPDLLGGHSPNYTKVEREGRTFWRVRVAGFGDLAQARAFCERVRAKGATCSVADF
ncbi:MAG: SPOR domain-containing protein, partial [Rhodospirillales bacterium]|nr:SPOR domain-containing protein [Rhodospirillales bacterium]